MNGWSLLCLRGGRWRLKSEVCLVNSCATLGYYSHPLICYIFCLPKGILPQIKFVWAQPDRLHLKSAVVNCTFELMFWMTWLSRHLTVKKKNFWRHIQHLLHQCRGGNLYLLSQCHSFKCRIILTIARALWTAFGEDNWKPSMVIKILLYKWE